MKLAAPLLLLATLAAVVACGDDSSDSPKFIGEGSGGRRASGGSSGDGGRASGGGTSTGGTSGSGGTSETGGSGSGGEDVDGGGGTPASGGAPGSGGTSETGGVQGSGGMVVKPVCHLSTTNEICDECIHDGCSFECVACEDNADCVATLACMLDCGATAKCLNDCKAQYPDGAAAFNSVTLDCGRARCSSFCPFFH